MLVKIIFLDIDGVLVTETHLLDLDAGRNRMTDDQGHHLFDPRCVENLKRILDATEAKIVISSCWKMFGLEMLSELWQNRQCPSSIHDLTPSKLSATRGHEIGIWLNDHKDEVESFVIIDDDVFDLHNSQMPFVVQTSWENGLTDSLADQAIAILNKEKM